MAVSVESFRQMFPEYRKADQGAITAKLSIARLRVNAVVWGDKADAGVLYLTAHLLALSPAGINAKLDPGASAKTIYWHEYKQMQRAVTYGLRTAGLPPAGATRDPVNGF